MPEPILVAQRGDIACHLLPALANRHGLITGATGTGKTITLQTLAEGLSKLGVPVFLSDIKGDLTGISQRGAREGGRTRPVGCRVAVGRDLPRVLHGPRRHAPGQEAYRQAA